MLSAEAREDLPESAARSEATSVLPPLASPSPSAAAAAVGPGLCGLRESGLSLFSGRRNPGVGLASPSLRESTVTLVGGSSACHPSGRGAWRAWGGLGGTGDKLEGLGCPPACLSP